MANNRIALLFSAVQSDGEMTLEAAPATASAEIYPRNDQMVTVQLCLGMTRTNAEELLEALYSGNATVLVESLAALIETKNKGPEDKRPSRSSGSALG